MSTAVTVHIERSTLMRTLSQSKRKISAIIRWNAWVQKPFMVVLNVTDAGSQSNEIIDLVAMIGLGDGNRSAAGRLRNDVRRSLKSVFSSKTRDKLKNTEQRMAVRPRLSVVTMLSLRAVQRALSVPSVMITVRVCCFNPDHHQPTDLLNSDLTSP